MKILTEGHKYELASMEVTNPQVLQFIQKEPSKEDTTKFVTVCDGTTNEEVLKVLINRLQVIYVKLPSRETAIVITKLEESLMWLEKRTRDRLNRGVEGTPLK